MSDFFSADIDADLAIERVQQQIADAQARAVKAQQMRGDIEAVRGVASSPRREVTVTVDASGRLADVDLAETAYDLAAPDLGRLIVETSQAAQRAAGEQALALAAAAFGEDSSVVDHLRAELDKEPPTVDADTLR